jgi:hypothetical protein
MKDKKGKVTIQVRRAYFITFNGRQIDAHWNSFPSFKEAEKYFNHGFLVHLKNSEYGILRREIKETHTVLLKT